MNDLQNREPTSRGIVQWGWYSIGLNILLIALNFIIARLSGSLSVSAEMVHNVVDFITAGAVLAGIQLSTRKTKTFPYGLHKIENVISIFIAGMIFLTAYELARSALFPNGAGTTLYTRPWMSFSLGGALVLTLVFSILELRAGRTYDSPALIADAKEYRVHGITTGIALLALQSPLLSFPIDRIGAVFIVLAIIKTGWDLLVDVVIMKRQPQGKGPNYVFQDAGVNWQSTDAVTLEAFIEEIRDELRQ